MAINDPMLASIDLVIENEGVSLTEAVRRLIGYGDFVYRAIKQDGHEVLVRNGADLREIALL